MILKEKIILRVRVISAAAERVLGEHVPPFPVPPPLDMACSLKLQRFGVSSIEQGTLAPSRAHARVTDLPLGRFGPLADISQHAQGDGPDPRRVVAACGVPSGVDV